MKTFTDGHVACNQTKPVINKLQKATFFEFII